MVIREAIHGYLCFKEKRNTKFYVGFYAGFYVGFLPIIHIASTR